MCKIRAIIKRPDEQVGHVSAISPTLENLQKTVGGYIEAVRMLPFGCAKDGYYILCDEEGRYKKNDFNCMVKGVPFLGTIIVIGSKGEEFTDCPLSFSEWKELVNTGGNGQRMDRRE